jgi:hypothetical protein
MAKEIKDAKGSAYAANPALAIFDDLSIKSLSSIF